MTCRCLAVLLLFVTLSAGSLWSPPSVWAETLVESDVQTRTVLAFRVGQPALQRWVPEPLQITPVAAGPYKDANLIVVFFDKLIKLDAEDKPSSGGNDRGAIFVVSAKHPQAEKPNLFVIRIFNANIPDAPRPLQEFGSGQRAARADAERR